MCTHTGEKSVDVLDVLIGVERVATFPNTCALALGRSQYEFKVESFVVCDE